MDSKFFSAKTNPLGCLSLDPLSISFRGCCSCTFSLTAISFPFLISWFHFFFLAARLVLLAFQLSFKFFVLSLGMVSFLSSLFSSFNSLARALVTTWTRATTSVSDELGELVEGQTFMMFKVAGALALTSGFIG